MLEVSGIGSKVDEALHFPDVEYLPPDDTISDPQVIAFGGIATFPRGRIMGMFLAILGPEVVLTYAAGQWSTTFGGRFPCFGLHSMDYASSLLRRVGGFVLHAHLSASFTLDAKQLHWLVVNEHVRYPKVHARQEEIWCIS